MSDAPISVTCRASIGKIYPKIGIHKNKGVGTWREVVMKDAMMMPDDDWSKWWLPMLVQAMVGGGLLEPYWRVHKNGSNNMLKLKWRILNDVKSVKERQLM